MSKELLFRSPTAIAIAKLNPLLVFLVFAAGCRAPTNPDNPPAATQLIGANQAVPYLPYRQPVPASAALTQPPEPYQRSLHGAPVVTGESPVDPPHWGDARLRRHIAERRQAGRGLAPPPDPSAPPPGTGDNGFLVFGGVGIYAGNDPQRDLEIPSWAFGISPSGDTGAVIYAPTHMTSLFPGSTRACLEATTIHWRYAGWAATSDLHGFWDWCAADPNFQAPPEDMNNASWLSKYVRIYFGEERFYIAVIPDNPASSEGGCWRGLLYNYNLGQWEQKALSCGTSSSQGSTGWTVWESWYMMPNCPTLPDVKAADLQIKLTNGQWTRLDDQHATPLGAYGLCWTATRYYGFEVHSAAPYLDYWHAHTTPLSLSVSGPTEITQAGTYTWYALVTGGLNPYTYSWDYCPAGGSCSTVSTSGSYTRTIQVGDPNFDLLLRVTSGPQSHSVLHSVCMTWGGPLC